MAGVIYLPFLPEPGINHELTPYADKGKWYDCNKIRFRENLPEKIGGWSPTGGSGVDAFVGICRCLFQWTILTGQSYIGIGTSKKLYIQYGETLYDITPIRRTVTLGASPIATTNGSGTITITDTSHGASVGDYVTISGASAFNGLTSGQLNTEFSIVTVPNANTYTVLTSGTANATSSGGGASVVAAYQIAIGADSYSSGSGWGTGGYGSGGYGTGTGSVTSMGNFRIWFLDNFGEDLVAAYINSVIYYWDATSGTSTRAVALSTMTGASDVPTQVGIVRCLSDNRHICAYGCNAYGTSTYDPMLVRWSDQENAVDWTPAEDNTAGEYRLQNGSTISAVLETRQETLIWTDQALYSQRFSGPPYTFGFFLVGENIHITSANAMASLNDAVFWMGHTSFFVYQGRVSPLPCKVKDYVFGDINRDQAAKIFAGTIAAYDEVWWFYCSNDSTEIDRYVVYNMVQNAWYYGTLARTAWNDAYTNEYPIAASTTGYVFDHELGVDAQDTPTGGYTAIEAYIQSGDIDLAPDGPGKYIMFLQKVIPDVQFDGSTSQVPEIDITVRTKTYPGDEYTTTFIGSVIGGDASILSTTPLTTYTIGSYTPKFSFRKRARQVSVKLSSDNAGTRWRAGVTRFQVRPDGRRV